MDPIMGVSSLHCCLAVLLHSFLGLTHPCTVPDFCFLLFCFSFSSCGCLPCDTLCCICRGKKIHNAVHCTIFDILLLGINNLIEYKISYWSVNPHSCWDQKKNPSYLSWALIKEREMMNKNGNRLPPI